MSGSPAESTAVRYARWVLRHRWAVLLATLAVAMLMTSGAKNLGFDNSYRIFFGKDNPQLQAFEALENIYSKNDNVLFVLAPEGGEAFSAEAMVIVTDLTEAAWQLPYARRVDSPS